MPTNIFLALLFAGSSLLQAQNCDDLFISAYLEGASYDKAIEIYNPTGSPISLDNYAIRRYTNGNASPATISFTTGASIAANDVYVIAHGSSNAGVLAVADQISGSINHNGDDAYALYDGTDNIDVIGVIGVDPGTNWPVGSGSTKDHLLTRKNTVLTGVNTWNTSEWDVNDDETWSLLGSHNCDCHAINTWNGTSWSSTFSNGDNVLFNANYTVAAGSTLEVGSIEVASGFTLTIDAASSGYGQLKANGSITNNGTIIQKQYISSTGHHGISSPMTTGFGTTSGTASSLYEYDASGTGAYVGSYVGNGSASTSTVGRGFFAPVGNSGDFLTAIGEFSVTGTPNTSHDWTLSYVTNSQSGASDNGWNLIGNPYSATLDWNSVSVGSNVNGAIYVWDPANSQYMSWTTLGGVNGGSQYIPPMQAFWVQTASGGTGTAYDVNTTMSSNTLTSQSPTFNKSQNDILKLSVLDLSNTSKSDETIIANVQGSLDGFDGGIDAWKLPNDGGNPNIYSFHTGDQLAINAVDITNPKVIPMGIDAPQSGSMYELSLQQVVNADLYEVLLEDKHLNTITDITKTPYSFQYGGWTNNTPRFNLHLSATNSIGVNETLKDNSYVYQHENQIFIHSEAHLYTSYELWAIDGRLIQKGEISSSVTKFTKPQTGLYLIKLIGNSNNHTIKTFLK
ncbi:lamin tail domain-containing protein [Schleiferiaceae bacterium]|nr:lamin tail domain-containing protein [Schleiferiaceae bacterium]